MRLSSAGRTTAYLDLAQLGLVRDLPATRDAGAHPRRAAAVADLWALYRDVGAQDLVLSGRVHTAQDVQRYRDALGDTPLLVCRVSAGREQLRERVLARTRGEGAVLAGDELVGLPESEVDAVVDSSWAAQARLEAAAHEDQAVEDLVLDTDDLPATVAAQRLADTLDETDR
jgi:hypothetical protein